MIIISVDDVSDARQVYDLASGDLPPGSVQISTGSRGFSGVISNDVLILAAIVSPVVIKGIADYLIGLVTSRANREVTINGVSLKGYTAEEAAKLLRASAGQADQSPQPAP